MTSPDLYDQIADSAAHGDATGAAALTAGQTVVLYGAGNIGRDALRVLAARGIGVRCFLDRGRLAGGQCEGVPVFLPDDPALGPETRGEFPVIITVFNPQTDGESLARDLQRLGWEKVVPFVKFHHGFADGMGERYWLTDPGFYADRRAELRRVAGLWADERSLAVYDAILRFRWRGEVDAVLSPDLTSQYFPDDLPPWTQPARFVDCGAYDGDTLRQIQQRQFPLEAVAAFEPDPAHLPKLSATYRELGTSPATTDALFWPCAVHARTMQLRFAAGLGTSSGLREDAEEVVQAVALDDVIPNFRPTFIKMDIEGAEHDALLGAREMIQRHRPGLAICVYHRPGHLLEIPLLLQSWGLGYRFWLRLHAYNGYELVLYAQADKTWTGQPEASAP